MSVLLTAFDIKELSSVKHEQFMVCFKSILGLKKEKKCLWTFVKGKRPNFVCIKWKHGCIASFDSK